MEWNRDRERKAGRAMGISGCVYGIVFMVVWCAIAATIGAWFMLIFGLPMLGFMIFRLIMCLRLTKQKQAPPQDPWDRPESKESPSDRTGGRNDFCPYCGIQLDEDFEFCPKCGRRRN